MALVHDAVGAVILGEAVAADLKGQPHAEEGEGEGDQRCQGQPPVQAHQRRDADNRQYDVPRPLRDHVGQGRLYGFDLIHHGALDLADGVTLHVAQGRVQKAVGQPQPQTLQNIVCHGVGHPGGQAEQQDLSCVKQKRQQAPAYHRPGIGRPGGKQADHFIHAVKRRQPQHNAQHRQDDRQPHPLFLSPGIGE